ncbi:hypothetical protein QBC46DRAFT_355240 [Diplogelasinospora grovesii]|uniref:Uncharacterized protein n=1 Tax=Diplogelasinospora grovesii TaxID=303347 RepID=A0AAN6N7M5_9PEZI|nr:hypothetical protein QBC46DRAFT_355240 [Diplogelasinospora grovesii]
MANTNPPSQFTPAPDRAPNPSRKSGRRRRLRTCCSSTLSAYDLLRALHPPSTRQICRRLCMWIIMLLRTFMSVLNITSNAFGQRVVSLVLGILLAIISFIYVGWCLAVIGEAQGSRRVCGVNIGRTHLDVMLVIFAISHIALFIGAFTPGLGALAFVTIWVILWLLVVLVAWFVARPLAPMGLLGSNEV